MIEVAIIAIVLFGLILLSGVGVFLYTKNNETKEVGIVDPLVVPVPDPIIDPAPKDGVNKPKKQEAPPKAPSGSTATGCGAWKDGGTVSYYDVFHPTDGNGSVAEVEKPNKKLFDEINVVSIHEEDWKATKYAEIEIQIDAPGYTMKPFVATAMDYCSDKDCAGDDQGCCTRNKKTYVNPGYLLDIEQRTAARVFGADWTTKFKSVGIVKAKYRICKPKHSKSSLQKKYKGK